LIVTRSKIGSHIHIQDNNYLMHGNSLNLLNSNAACQIDKLYFHSNSFQNESKNNKILGGILPLSSFLIFVP